MKKVVTATDKVTAVSSGRFFWRELNLAEKADDKNPNCAPKNAKKLNLGEEDWLSLFFRIFFSS